VNADLERSGRDIILRYYLNIRMEGLWKTTKNISRDTWFSGRDLNPESIEYESRVSTTRPRRSV
jgi:hypothetical protein